MRLRLKKQGGVSIYSVFGNVRPNWVWRRNKTAVELDIGRPAVTSGNLLDTAGQSFEPYSIGGKSGGANRIRTDE